MVTNIIIAGLGGQGVIKASDILAEAAFRAGLDVKKSEIHGMSQRGGSVFSDVRFGPQVLSPMIPPGEADYLVVLSDDQIECNRHHLRAEGRLLTAADIDATQLPGSKSLNVALLAALSTFLEIDEEHWLTALRAHLPPRAHESNVELFLRTRQALTPGKV